jgi:uncharacterized membrane protein HdeD (DUF308 family)
MLNNVFHIIFLCITIFVFIYTTSYALYEINHEKNKAGGIGIIVFTVFSIVFSNIVVFNAL